MRGRRVSYTVAELEHIEALAALPRELILAELAAVFGRTDLTVDNIRQLCIRHGWATRTRWTDAEDAQLRTHFATMPTKTLAAQLGRSLSTTYQRAYALGLKKDEAYLASPEAGRLQPSDSRGGATRFPKGHVPANKGKKRGRGWAPGRMRDGQFTKGQNGWNWKPVGSTRIVDGYHYTKVSDHRHVVHTVNWKLTHVLRWEAEHGPIPAGHCLKCLDGDPLNTDPANWQCIERALLPLINGGRGGRLSFDQAPAELKPTVLAVAKLRRAVSKRRVVHP